MNLFFRWARFIAEKNPAIGYVLRKAVKAYRAGKRYACLHFGFEGTCFVFLSIAIAIGEYKITKKPSAYVSSHVTECNSNSSTFTQFNITLSKLLVT